MTNKLKKKLISLSILFSLGTSVAFISSSQLSVHAEETKVDVENVQEKSEDKADENKAEDKADEDKPSVKEVEEKIKIEAPASVTGQKTEGQGTVVDFSTSNSKNFFTIQDKEGNTFYLIIDMEKTENNVYFVSDVNKTHLEQGVSNNQPDKAPINQAVTQEQTGNNSQNETNVAQQPDKAPEVKQENGNSNFIKLVLGGFIAVLLGYYLLVFKKKKGTDNNSKKEEKENDTVPEDFENLNDDDVVGYAEEEPLEEEEGE